MTGADDRSGITTLLVDGEWEIEVPGQVRAMGRVGRCNQTV